MLMIRAVDGAAAAVHLVGLVPETSDDFLHLFRCGMTDVTVAWAAGTGEDEAVGF